ncbi:MAG: RNA polymerase sigma factor [Clostridiales bacterium]|nr:RNA polymerase sigma factor [Clostridiales bacterium]
MPDRNSQPTDLQSAAALESFAKEHYDAIYRYCYHKVGSVQTAQDLTQETFLRFMAGLSAYEHRGKPLALLYTIARNLCYDWYRMRKPLSLEQMMEQPVREPAGPDAYGPLVSRIALEPALSALPPLQQEILLLRFGQELKLREIAEATGHSLFSVQYQLKTALKHLKQILGKEPME